MRWTWHIVRKDLFRLRWILTLWVVVMLGGLALATIQAGLDLDTYQPYHIAATVVQSGFLPLMGFGLVIGLLHDDPVADADAFWITRPISGLQLLVAKASALMLFGLMQILVLTPFWISHAFTSSQLGLAAWQTLRTHGVVVAAAVPFAVISANASKFVMNVMLGAGGGVLLAGIHRLSDSVAVSTNVLQSQVWLVAMIWLVASVTVTLIQFLRRRTRHSLTVLAIAAACGFAIAKWWTIDLEARSPDVAKPAARAAANVITTGDTDLLHAASSVALLQKVDDDFARLKIVSEVPFGENQKVVSKGVTLWIQSVVLDWTGELQISLSEAAPNFPDLLRVSSGVPTDVSDCYVLLNREDGRSFAFRPTTRGKDLTAAGVRFTHANVTVRPAPLWRNDAPSDVAAWLKSAVLVKMTAKDL